MRANKLFLILALLVGISCAKEEVEFLSIEEVNQSLKNRSQDLAEVFGHNIGSMQIASSVRAVLLGGVEDPGIERYMVFPLKGKFIDIDRQTAKLLYKESSISLDALGMGTPRFALMFQGERAENKVVILVCPPAKKNDPIWTFVECSTQKSAIFTSSVVPFISKIWQDLQEQEKHSVDHDKAKPNLK